MLVLFYKLYFQTGNCWFSKGILNMHKNEVKGNTVVWNAQCLSVAFITFNILSLYKSQKESFCDSWNWKKLIFHFVWIIAKMYLEHKLGYYVNCSERTLLLAVICLKLFLHGLVLNYSYYSMTFKIFSFITIAQYFVVSFVKPDILFLPPLSFWLSITMLKIHDLNE